MRKIKRERKEKEMQRNATEYNSLNQSTALKMIMDSKDKEDSSSGIVTNEKQGAVPLNSPISCNRYFIMSGQNYFNFFQFIIQN